MKSNGQGVVFFSGDPVENLLDLDTVKSKRAFGKIRRRLRLLMQHIVFCILIFVFFKEKKNK